MKRTSLCHGFLTLVACLMLPIACVRAQEVPPAKAVPVVEVLRVPDGGLQPQVVVRGNTLHLLYFKGDAQAGDLFYSSSRDEGVTFAPPLRVNSQPGSVIAMGTIRGGQLALGRNGRVFVAWNGSNQAQPRNPAAPASQRKYGASPMLFTRLRDTGNSFEPQRNLMTKTFGLDGGGSVAADEAGRVYVAWHGNDKEGEDEGQRQVYLTVSGDDGATFAPEKAISDAATGACGCCQVRLMAQDGGRVSLLYRSARAMENRDTYLLKSENGGRSFQGRKLHEWRIAACPMSSYALIPRGTGEMAAWETAEEIYFAPLSADGTPAALAAAPGRGSNRKHPVLTMNRQNQTLLAWTEETGWNRGGAVCWQVLDAKNRPIDGVGGQQKGIPAWSFAAAFARQDGSFVILF